MLNEKEKEAINSLPKNFNIVHENLDYNYMSSVRADFSRGMASKLLIASILLVSFSICAVIGASIVYLAKPKPQIYVSTPSGKIYKLEQLKVN